MNKITEKLEYSLTIMHDQSKFAEAKNASMIVFTSALLVGIIANYESIKKLFNFKIITKFIPFNDIAFEIAFSLTIVYLILSIYFSIFSFIPQINQKILENNITPNLLMFDSNASFSSSKELEKFYKKKYKKTKKYNLDISNQIFNLSRIASRKYNYFKKATLCLFYGPIITIIIYFLLSIILGS